MATSERLESTFCGIRLKNPVLAASGTFGYGVEFASILDLNQLGGIVVKGLSAKPIEGNKAPRLWEAEAGMMNAVGLQNIGARAFVEEKLPALRAYQTPIFANVFGYAEEDYLEVVRILNDAEGIAAYELNVSCPNTKMPVATSGGGTKSGRRLSSRPLTSAPARSASKVRAMPARRRSSP